MSEYRSISELLQNSSRDIYFDRIPTESKHEVTARSILNRLISQNPDWFPAAAAFVIYPAQKWAQLKRKELVIDIRGLSEEDYFGIKTKGRFQNQLVSLQETDREIDLVTQILNSPADSVFEKKMNAVINAIHGTEAADVSKYMLEEYYEKGMRKVFESYWDQFRILNLEMAKGIDSGEYEDVYHNTDLLIRQLNAIDGMASRRWSDVQYDNACKTILKCIDTLKSYSEEGEILQIIVESYARGETETRTAERVEKSRTYVRSRYRFSVEILSYLIWGYSTREVLQPYLHQK